MDEINIAPDELFKGPETINISINGIKTKIVTMSDEHGNYFAIPATNDILSDICGQFINGKLIKELDYSKYQGRVSVIKAYFY